MRKLVVAGLAMALLVGALGQAPATADEPVEPTPVDPGVQCVGSPPRQTFDPLSPPCVPFFDGDNGCATYGLGVTCDEVKIAIVMDGGINYSTGSGPFTDRNIAPSDRKIYDLERSSEENNAANGDPATNAEHLTVEGFRTWQQYFNERFQTYGRKVHFFIYYADPSDNTPEHRRINAVDIREEINPFAVVSFASEGAEDSLMAALARKGVLNFGSFGMRTDAFFSSFPKMVWNFAPSVEQRVSNYGAYLCASVVGRAPVLAAADIQDRNALPAALGGNNGVRKLGLISAADPNHPELARAGDLVENSVQGCAGPGNDVALRAEFPTCCLAQDNGEVPAYALAQMAAFKAQGVTTILWAGGLNGNYGKAAAAIGYFPEWIVLGDGSLDANLPVVLSQNSASFDGRAIVITPEVVEGELPTQPCWRAYREINSTTPDEDLGYTCDFYRSLHMLFTAIQVAGPYLGPTNIDKGLHAMPQRESGSPTVPACFFLPGDYTCVKDAQAEIWDATGLAPGSKTPGCWRSIQGGQRYHHTLNPWPTGNVNTHITGDPESEPCNAHSSSARFNLS